MTTGDTIFVETYLNTDRVLRSQPPTPRLIFPANSQAELTGPVEFQWTGAVDDTVTYKRHIWAADTIPDDNEAESVSLKDNAGRSFLDDDSGPEARHSLLLESYRRRRKWIDCGERCFPFSTQIAVWCEGGEQAKRLSGPCFEQIKRFVFE